MNKRIKRDSQAFRCTGQHESWIFPTQRITKISPRAAKKRHLEDSENDNDNENNEKKKEEEDVGNNSIDDDVACPVPEQSKDVDQFDDDASCSSPIDADASSSSVRNFPEEKASAIEQDGAEHNIMDTEEHKGKRSWN